MKSKLLIWLVILLMPVCALAQELDAVGSVLLDLAASAAVGPEGKPEGFDSGDHVPAGFAQRFLMTMGMDSLEEAQERRAYLSLFLAAPVPDMEVLAEDMVLTRAGMQIMSVDMDEDGQAAMVIGQLYRMDAQQQMVMMDARAIAELHRSEASPLGWQLHRFVIGQELMMEEAAQAYFEGATVEYYNAQYGFAVQYPALFPEESVEEDAYGVNAELPEEKVSFFARWEEKTKPMNELIEGKKKEFPSLSANINESTGCICMQYVHADGVREIHFYLEGEQAVYHAGITFPEDAQNVWAPYAEYMMNSLTADELDLG